MHLVLDVTCKQGLDDGAAVAAFIHNLVALLPGVHIRFGPHVEKFGNGTSYGPGITAVCIISESHIVVHTAPERRLLQLDVFSCNSFAIDEVGTLVDVTFKIDEVLFRKVLER